MTSVAAPQPVPDDDRFAALEAQVADLRAEVTVLKAAVAAKPRKPSDADVAWFRAVLAEKTRALFEPFLAAQLFADPKTAGERLSRLVGFPVSGFVVRRFDEEDHTTVWLVEPAGDLGDLRSP
jgi:hypothetical protein